MIARLAARQHGIVARYQLLDAGVAEKAIDYRLKTGRLRRLRLGVYAIAGVTPTPLMRASAAVLACGPTAALSHRSAAALWGMRRHWDSPIEVAAARRRAPRGIRTYRSATLTAADLTTHRGIKVTSPARTLLDVANHLTDEALTRALNDALLSRHLTSDDLSSLLGRIRGLPGHRKLERTALPHGAPTRSHFEDRFLKVLRRHRLPPPLTNQQLAGHEVDAVWPDRRLVAELDSRRHHADPGAFERDRDRDADLLAAGYATIRITWARLTTEPAREVARLRAILAARAATG